VEIGVFPKKPDSRRQSASFPRWYKVPTDSPSGAHGANQAIKMNQ